MNRMSIARVLERMNCLERMKNKYDDRSCDLYQQGERERSAKLDHKVDLYEKEIEGMQYTLRQLGLGVWKTTEGEWVIPQDDIIRAI